MAKGVDRYPGKPPSAPEPCHATSKVKRKIAGKIVIDMSTVQPADITALAAKVRYVVDPTNPYPKQFTGHLRDLLRDPRLGRVLIGTALFWVCGAAMKINFQPWGLEVLNLPDNTQIALLGLWLSVGVMGGSILAGQLHAVGDLRRTRTYGFILAGMLALLATVNSLGFWRTPVVQLGPLHLVVPVVLLLVAIVSLILVPQLPKLVLLPLVLVPRRPPTPTARPSPRRAFARSMATTSTPWSPSSPSSPRPMAPRPCRSTCCSAERRNPLRNWPTAGPTWRTWSSGGSPASRCRASMP